MTYSVTNENTGETFRFTNKKKAMKLQREISKLGGYSNLYVFDEDKRVS